MKKIVLGLSDGVDSAVAGVLLRQAGFEVLGVYLDIGSEENREAARESAREAGIGFRCMDVKARMETCVCAPFAREYLRGRTPSPCPGCNQTVKLPVLLEAADEYGAEEIATGHYVRKQGDRLYMGDASCDQSYMFAHLTPGIVERLRLPLGEMRKSDVRRMAAEWGLSCANRPDSRENCFIRGMDYAAYIRCREGGRLPGAGDVYFQGRIVDRHEGIYRYTVGQRWARDMGERRAYVSEIDAENNTLTLALWESLFTRRTRLSHVSFLSGQAPGASFEGAIRVRHTRWETPSCRVTLTGNGEALIETESDLRAPAPGQTAALYEGTRLLGGGIVEKFADGVNEAASADKEV